MRYLTTTAIALSGYLQKWRHSNLFKVNAQPSHPRDEDEETECLHPAKRVKYEFNSPEKAEYKPPSLQECLDERKRNIAKAAAINREIFAKHANFGTQNLNYQYGGAIFPHPKVAKRFLIEYDDFILCYDNTTRVPCWTLEEITGESGELSMMAKPRPYDREESWVPHEFRTGLRHYQYAFDMIKLQHLAEFDIHPEGVGDPCVYTNVVAQRIEDNDHSVRTLWDEFRCYEVYLSSMYKSVFILTGTLFLPKERDGCKRTVRTVQYDLLERRLIAIPTNFFKVILYQNTDGSFHLECYIFENKLYDTNDLRKFLVTRCELENIAGFLIFNKIQDTDIQDCQTEQSFATKRYYKPTCDLSEELDDDPALNC